MPVSVTENAITASARLSDSLSGLQPSDDALDAQRDAARAP